LLFDLDHYHQSKRILLEQYHHNINVWRQNQDSKIEKKKFFSSIHKIRIYLENVINTLIWKDIERIISMHRMMINTISRKFFRVSCLYYISLTLF
jgi:hypothetical protein